MSVVMLPGVSLAAPVDVSYISYLEILVLKFSSWENWTSQTISSWPPTLCHPLFISPSLLSFVHKIKLNLINVNFVQAIFLVPGDRGVQKINMVHFLIGFKF